LPSLSTTTTTTTTTVFDGVETPLFRSDVGLEGKLDFFYEEKTREKSALIIL
tara:strand:+ start:185 stop:340 length:156 start_codon:yes stop_codon:yes gene_type:complete